MSRLDPHSYADATHARVRHLTLSLDVDFSRQSLLGEAILDFEAPASGTLDLDTKELEILEARNDAGLAVAFELLPEQPILGRCLRLSAPRGHEAVADSVPHVAGGAGACSGCNPNRPPVGGTRSSSASARPSTPAALLPCPDTPRQRLAYDAAIVVPEPLAAVMSAGPARHRPGPRPGTRVFRFRMPQPIPPYLLAFAVGGIVSRELSPRAAVWAEPSTLEAAAHEFAEIESMIPRPRRSSGRTTGTATTCWCCRPRSPTAAWRTRA